MQVALVVTSDHVYRGDKADEVTPLVEKAVSSRGHVLVFRTVVPNDWIMIRRAVLSALSRADLVLISGGTGPSPKDLSIEVVRSMADKELPGFGELFRQRSEPEVGVGAALSRASLFIVGGSLVLVTPGSPSAVRLALDLVMDIAQHALEQARGEPHH